MKDYLRREQAAEYLQSKFGAFTRQTLAKLASVGGGPRFRKFGRYPVYTVADLDEWVAGRMSAPFDSTAEASVSSRVLEHGQTGAAPSADAATEEMCKHGRGTPWAPAASNCEGGDPFIVIRDLLEHAVFDRERNEECSEAVKRAEAWLAARA